MAAERVAMKQSNAPSLHAREKAALNESLDDLLSKLVAVNGWLDIEHYREVDALLGGLTKHEPWRSHLRFYDLWETLGFFIRKYEVSSTPGVGVRIADALTANRFKGFRD